MADSRICPGCKKVYWEGAHAARFMNRLRELRAASSIK